MKDKILIVGSEGFIGSHLSGYLRSKDFDVLNVDILEKKQTGYVQIDKENPDYHAILKDFPAEVCINCSGAASVPFSFEQPLNDFTLNVYNVVKMLDAIRLYSPGCKYINFSSAAVYGNPKSIPITEAFEKNPISPYGFHKSMVENVLEEYYRYFNLNTCTLRLFSAYGDGLKKQIMFDLYNKFKNNEKVELFGTGKETRDYIHVDDICRAVEIVINNSDFKNDVVNVANGVEVELVTIATLYKKFMNSEKEIVFSGNVRTGDPSRWQADISKIKGWGYEPTVKLEDGIKDYVKWIQNI